MIAVGRYKINPRRRFCCITAVSRFKFARFDPTDSNVRKRLLETGRTNGLRSRSIDDIQSTHPLMGRHFGGKGKEKLRNNKDFLQKNIKIIQKSAPHHELRQKIPPQMPIFVVANKSKYLWKITKISFDKIITTER